MSQDGSSPWEGLAALWEERGPQEEHLAEDCLLIPVQREHFGFSIPIGRDNLWYPNVKEWLAPVTFFFLKQFLVLPSHKNTHP